MNDNHIKGLQEALALSPDNLPLRLMLAEGLLKVSRLNESEDEFKKKY